MKTLYWYVGLVLASTVGSYIHLTNLNPYHSSSELLVTTVMSIPAHLLTWGVLFGLFLLSRKILRKSNPS
jgi:hypothetical protein